MSSNTTILFCVPFVRCIRVEFQYRHMTIIMAANQHSSCMRIFPQVCQIEFSMSKQADIVKDFLGSSRVTSLDYIRKIVLRHQHSHLTLKNWEGNIFRVGTLKDTLYKDELDILEEWEQFYLPEHTSMQVIGVLKTFSYKSLNGELVLMVCEDGKVFAYVDEEMHLVAKSLKELFESGPQYPGIIQYYRGQSFEDMTDADWNSVKQSPKMIAQKKKNQDILESMENCYLRDLSIIMEKCQVEQPCRTSGNEERRRQHGGNRGRNLVKKPSRCSSDFSKWRDEFSSQTTKHKRVKL